jgi:hypothetical protein
MATLYASEANGYLNSNPVVLASGAVHNARMRRFRAKITLASQGTSDTIVLARVPKGMAFAYGVLNSSVSLGTSTIAIGITGTTDKYRAAATFTATDTPTLFGKVAAAAADPLNSDETIFITIGTAALPSSGTLVVDLYFSGA